MGVNLSPITEARPIELTELRGKTVAIDAYNTIFQFLSIIRQPDGKPLSDDQGRVTSHLSGLLYRTANLIENGIEPSFVFDGKPNELKAGTIEERIARREKATQEYQQALEEGDLKKAFSKAQQTSRMTPEILSTSKELLTLMGIPVVQAPSDGEAQGAYMCAKGDVYASASQDFDSILFGAPLLVRNLTVTGRRKVPGKSVYKTVQAEVIDSEKMLGDLGITREQLVDVCIMIGTDFNPGVSGIGPKKGLKLIQKHGNLENVIEANGYDIPGYEDVREIFLNGPRSDDYSVKAGELDFDGVIDMMTGYGFSEDRVRTVLNKIEASRKAESDRRKQRSLDSWFRDRRQRRQGMALGEPPAAIVAAPAVLDEPPLGLGDVTVDLPASDAPAASPGVLDVAPHVLHRIVQEHAHLRGHGTAQEPGRQLGHHALRTGLRVSVSAEELAHVRLGEPPAQDVRAVDVHEHALIVCRDDGDPDPFRSQRSVYGLDTMGPVRPEHASALQARQCRRTVADYAFLQILVVVIGIACLCTWLKVVGYYVGNTPAGTGDGLGPHGN